MVLVLVIIILCGGCFDSDDCGDHRGVRIPWSTVSCHHQPSSPSNPSIYHSSFFQHFFVFILASSGFTPFFDPPTAVKEQQRMQDVGSDSGDTFGYLWIPSSWHSAVDTLTAVGYIGGTCAPPDTRLIRLHTMDTSKIKLQPWILGWFYNRWFAYTWHVWQVIWLVGKLS